MSLKDNAIAMAKRGFAVFPLHPKSKKPCAGYAWQELASTDIKVIDRWPKETTSYGVVVKPPVFVIDIDPKNNGYESLPKLGILPNSFMVKTASGGAHIYFTADQKIGNSAGRLGRGIDVRGEGGYVVGAGSIISDGGYSIVRDIPLAPAPPELVERAVYSPEDLSGVKVSPELARAGAIEYLRNAQPAIEGQGGDSRTYAVAARLKEFGVSQSVANELMLEYFNPRCEPQWQEGKLRSKIKNAYDYADVRREPMLEFPRPSEQDIFKSLFMDEHEIALLRPPDWLVQGWIPMSSVGMLVGEAGSYKSFFALDIALRVSSGLDYLQRKVKQGRAMYAAGEGKMGFGHRLAAWKTYHGVGNVPDFFMVRDFPYAGSDSLTKLIAFAGQYDLLIIDTLSRYLDATNENYAHEVMPAINRLEEVRKKTDCTILFVHHPPHGEKRPRGSTGIIGAMDFILSADKPQGVERKAVVSVLKQKEADPQKPILFNMVDSEASIVPVQAESGTAATPTDMAIQQQTQKEDRVRSKIMNGLKKVLEKEGGSVMLKVAAQQVAEAEKLNEDMVQHWLLSALKKDIGLMQFVEVNNGLYTAFRQ